MLIICSYTTYQIFTKFCSEMKNTKAFNAMERFFHISNFYKILDFFQTFFFKFQMLSPPWIHTGFSFKFVEVCRTLFASVKWRGFSRICTLAFFFQLLAVFPKISKLPNCLQIWNSVGVRQHQRCHMFTRIQHNWGLVNLSVSRSVSQSVGQMVGRSVNEKFMAATNSYMIPK